MSTTIKDVYTNMQYEINLKLIADITVNIYNLKCTEILTYNIHLYT